MRNLKRALSLTLASVMLLGMMVVGSSAAAGYSDVDDNDNVEAIEVLQAVKVMVGDDRGFGPDRPVTRNEMAVVMGKLLNLDYNYYSASCPFTDVADWAKGWVGAAAANGIVSGRGNGIYDGEATVTAVEAASMMMRALGYFKYQNDYADGFQVATVRQGTKIGIFDQVGTDATTAMTRNQVAQMALNALQSGMVEPDGNTINLTTPDGSVFTGKVNYVYTTSKKDFARAISPAQASSAGSYNDGSIVELGEQLYNGDLKLYDDRTDDFGRPSRNWEYDGKSIGTYMKKELIRAEYTEKVTGRMLYELLTKDTIDRYGFEITVDGETEKAVLNPSDSVNYGYFTKNNLIRTNTEAVGATGNGVLTQVFVDNDRERVYISVINTYLAQATDDYNEKKDEVSFEIFGVEEVTKAKLLVKNTGDSDAKAGKQAYTETRTVNGDDFDIKDVQDEDIVLVRVAEGEIKEIIDPEVIDNTEISTFKKGKWVNTGDAQYDYANTALYDTEVLDEYDETNMKDTNYRVFLDMYGYAIGLEIIEEPDQFVFLTGIDLGSSNLTNKTADGNVIFLDGTMDTVKIKMDKSENAQGDRFVSPTTGNDGQTHAVSAADGTAIANTKDTYISALMNTWCKYTVDKNGVYTLTEIANTEATFEAAGNKLGQSHTVDPDSVGANGGNQYVNDSLSGDVADKLVEIDKKHVSLYGIEDTDFERVYGNENTVYLSAETDIVGSADQALSDAKKPAVIISGVDAVTTGVKNASLQAWNAEQVIKDDGVNNKYQKLDPVMLDVSHGVYTLFKDNGYVIAAVVVGEDQGTSSDYVFVTSADGKSGMSQEGYDKENDEWTWTREVIRDGKVAELTEKGSGSPALKDMERDNWYEVRYDANGNVRKVIHIDFTSGATDEYNDSMANVEGAINAHDTVILHDDLGDQVYSISVKGNTLQIETSNKANKMGFAVAEDANIVLIQDKSIDGKHSTDMDDIFEYSNGEKGLQKAVNRLNGNIKGHVSAILEGGVATTVIIWDLIENDVITGSETFEDADSPAKATLDFDTLEVTDLVIVDDNVKKPIGSALTGAGLKVTSWDTTNRKVTAVDNENNVYTFTWAAPGNDAKNYSVTVDDKVVEYVKHGGDSKITEKQIKPSSNAGTGMLVGGSYQPYNADDTTLIASNVTSAKVIKTGYVAVNTTGVTVTATGFKSAVKFSGADTDEQTLDSATYAKAGDSITFVFEVDTTPLDLVKGNAAKFETTNSGDTTNGVVASKAIVCSDTAKVDGTATAELLTFVKTPAGTTLAAGTTISVTYNLGNKDLVTTMKFTAAKD